MNGFKILSLPDTLHYQRANTLLVICSITKSKVLGERAAILWRTSFLFRQNILCRRIPLTRSNDPSIISSFNLKYNGSVSGREVICTQTKSNDWFTSLLEIIRAGLSFVCERSVNGKCARIMSRCRNSIEYYFLRWAYATSQRSSSGLFQSSANEGSETSVYSSANEWEVTSKPISSAMRISNRTLSSLSASMVKLALMDKLIYNSKIANPFAI